MSFRLRVLGLVALVAVSATAVTAWLTLRQASQQINESVTAGQAQLELVTDQLQLYGSQHATWEGVASVVAELGDRTGQRIHLESESGDVISDTDTQQGRDARQLGTVMSIVDPRPRLSLAGVTGDAATATRTAIRSYRAGVLFAACLTRRDVRVIMTLGDYGVPVFTVAPGADTPDAGGIAAECRDMATQSDPNVEGDDARIAVCRAPHLTSARDACLAQAFADQISAVAPVPVLVYLGASDSSARSLSAGPLLAAAGLVAAVAIIGTALFSHRVLRPIGTLTVASRQLGQGDLAKRVPVRGNDELAGLARSFNRMADSLQHGEERQRRLVADVAHELRTPLANLRGYLEALKDGVIEPDPELFASLHEEAVLQQRIVDDLQDLAQAEAGSLAYHRTTVDLAELLETCRTAHRALAESDRVSLTVEAEPVPVSADPDRLRQVIGNLITNALRATPAGGSVSLSVRRLGDDAVVRVADTGSGIAVEALPYVFDRFWRADSARGRSTGGSGLGLAIARQIVTDHGGAVTVASEPGRGTTFTITLPAPTPG